MRSQELAGFPLAVSGKAVAGEGVDVTPRFGGGFGRSTIGLAPSPPSLCPEAGERGARVFLFV